ncbi:RNA methyltransferase [Mycena kentingensis (nom. inval.)]|nr:RNA methyltransferase [Mycena kentingensis (nom. inval.)]
MLCPSSVLSYATKSSTKQWIARQARDPYIKQRNTPTLSRAPGGPLAAWRSRAAFKLVQLDEKYNFLSPLDVRVVVDLGASPGGWSQVAARKLGWPMQPNLRQDSSSLSPYADEMWSPDAAPTPPLNRGRGPVIALDLLPMAPITGVQFIQGDLFAPDTELLLRNLIKQHTLHDPDPRADVVLCDMAANSTGNDIRDIESSLTICTSVFAFAKRHLRTAESSGREFGGVLLMKHFVHPLLAAFRHELVQHFADVRYVKPAASRTESKEAYYLCRGWKG